jgi:hypothetical protein
MWVATRPGIARDEPMSRDLVTIPARRGKVWDGQRLEIINTRGSQPVDFRAFVAGLRTEFPTVEHGGAGLLKLRPAVGDKLVTNKQPILTTEAHFAVPA